MDETTLANNDMNVHIAVEPVVLKPPHTPEGFIIVVKIGTSSLTGNSSGLPSFCLSTIGKLVDTVCKLQDMGHKVLVVSSGAVGAGCVAMRLRKRPETLREKQAVAAVGQCRLMRLYEDLFSIRERRVAQLLMTRSDFVKQTNYNNFRNTLMELISTNIIPIINENDSVGSEALRFGDNDTFAAHCAVAISAHWLFILTDVDCLYSSNPKFHADAVPVPVVDRLTDVYNMLGEDETGTQWGTGGMRTKIVACKIATNLGVHVAIVNGQHPYRICDILKYAKEHADLEDCVNNRWCLNDKEGIKIEKRVSCCPPPKSWIGVKLTSRKNAERRDNNTDKCYSCCEDGSPRRVAFSNNSEDPPFMGTIFVAQDTSSCPASLKSQKLWILSLPIRGKIWIDRKCSKDLITGESNLYASGVKCVEGNFVANEAISIFCEDSAGIECEEIARCLCNVTAQELRLINGKLAHEYKKILGYDCDSEVAHRSNIIFTFMNGDLERLRTFLKGEQEDKKNKHEYGKTRTVAEKKEPSSEALGLSTTLRIN